MAELPADLVEKAERELGETPSVRARALSELRQKLQSLKAEEQPHRTDDQYLLAFLRPQKFRVHVALQKLRAYTAFKRKHAELLKDMKAHDFDELIKADFLRLQLKRDKEGRLVIWSLPGKMKTLDNPNVLISWNIFSLEQTGAMFDPYMQVNGIVAVEDLEGLSVLQTLGMTGGPMRRVLDSYFSFMRDACPYRIRGWLLLNEPPFVDVLLAIPMAGAPLPITQTPEPRSAAGEGPRGAQCPQEEGWRGEPTIGDGGNTGRETRGFP